jgi:hypothetical protein
MDVIQRDSTGDANPPRRRLLEAAGFLLILAASTFLNWRNAFVTYDFFDMSAFMDAGYRVFIGQEPYVDFFYTAGPLHLYLHALSYHLMGFNRWAVLAQLLAVNAVFLVMAHLIARRILSVGESLLATAVSGVCFYSFIAHPWYDQNAAVWLCAGLLAAEYLPVKSGSLRGLLAPFLCGLAVAFAFFTKANIGVAGVGLFGLIFLISAAPLRALLACAAGALVGSAAVLLPLRDPLALFYQNFFAYPATERLLDVEAFRQILIETPYTYLAMVWLIVLYLGGRDFLRAQRHLFAVTAGLLCASVFACFSGSIMVHTNVLFVGLEVLYLMAICRRLAEHNTLPGRTSVIFAVRTLVVCFGCLALFSYVITVGVFPTTWEWRDSNLDRNYEMQNGPLRGWTCSSRIGPGVDGAVDYINRNVPRDERLFVFPDCTVIYGLTGRDSYRRTPFIFHLRKFPEGKLYDEFRDHFRREPPQWILLDRQREVYWANVGKMMRWLQIEGAVRTNYTPVARFGELTLLRIHQPQRGLDATAAMLPAGKRTVE